MLVLLAVGPVLLPEYRNPGAGRLDPVSVALSLAAILPIIYGLPIRGAGAALKAAVGQACTGGLQAAAIASAVVPGALAVLIFTGLRFAADPAHAGDAPPPTSAQPRTSESA